MNWLEGLLYGLISGLTEIMPVSSRAHQNILRQIFGIRKIDPIADFLVHLAVLIALIIGCRGMLYRLQRERRALQQGRRKRSDFRTCYDLRLLRAAIMPLMLLLLCQIFTKDWFNNSLIIGLFSIVNGLILYLAERFPQGNKDSRHVSVLDSIVFGAMGALSVLPGVSRVGASLSYATIRGVDRQHAMSWSMLLSIPAMCIICIFDVVGIFGAVVFATGYTVIAGYIMAAMGAFIGAYLCLFFIRTIVSRLNFAGFAYYSWGAALLAIVLYLIC